MAGVEKDVVSEDLEVVTQASDKTDKIIKLPLTRIKNIIKQDPDVSLASHDAVIMIAKATELFINELASASHYYTANAGRKTVQKKDVENAIEKSESMAFLEGTIDS